MPAKAPCRVTARDLRFRESRIAIQHASRRAPYRSGLAPTLPTARRWPFRSAIARGRRLRSARAPSIRTKDTRHSSARIRATKLDTPRTIFRDESLGQPARGHGPRMGRSISQPHRGRQDTHRSVAEFRAWGPRKRDRKSGARRSPAAAREAPDRRGRWPRQIGTHGRNPAEFEGLSLWSWVLRFGEAQPATPAP